jgi:TRAP-type C4-dicarboxylate transport system permease small subunit
VGDVGGDKAAEGAFGRVLRWLSLAAGWILVLLLLYTVADVVLRYVFNMPFRGSREFTQFMMAVIVFLGLAYCGWTGGHVAVDILERPLDKPGWRWVPGALTLISAVLFAAIAWYTLHDGIAQMRRVSNMLRWPIYPFIFVAALGSAAYSLVLFVQAARGMRQGKRETQ